MAMKALRTDQYDFVPGRFYGTPKELWGFRTQSTDRTATAVAREFLVANAKLLGLGPDLAGLERQRIIESLGAFHIIFQQRVMNERVHRAYVTVHVDRRGRVYLVKNRAVPQRLVPREAERIVGVREATERARRALPSPGRSAHVVATEEMWFPRGRGLVPCWRVRILRHRPAEDWIVYVNAKSGAILSAYDNLALAAGRALVFDPSPVTALGNHTRLLSERGRELRPPPEAYQSVRLTGLRASGYLDGRRVTTRLTSQRLRRRSRDFRCASHESGFEEAMVYYHVDCAIRYLEELGYRGRRAIFRAPLEANVRGTQEDNSWYSPATRALTFGTGWIDDAEDAETVLHEFGHAIQDAITPDFGQSPEAAAMGEGFGDYFAGSFFAEKKPRRYRNAVMTWDGLLIGLAEGTNPPCLRLLNSKATYDDFRPRRDEHDNGVIWSATLWDIRSALGREVADTIIVESHFQLDGFTTFARAARAIIDADTNLHRGRHIPALRRIFKRRRIAPI
jgi:hypothetical protein